MLVKFDTKEKRIHEYPLPTPYASIYTAQTDKNGEVWAGEMHAGRYLRFNPKTEQWTEYVLPEPYGIDRETWIDNSTDPVTVWYVDHEGWHRAHPADGGSDATRCRSFTSRPTDYRSGTALISVKRWPGCRAAPGSTAAAAHGRCCERRAAF